MLECTNEGNHSLVCINKIPQGATRGWSEVYIPRSLVKAPVHYIFPIIIQGQEKHSPVLCRIWMVTTESECYDSERYRVRQANFLFYMGIFI
jgi:hypothetical protein